MQYQIRRIVFIVIFIGFILNGFCFAENFKDDKFEVVWDKNLLFSVPQTYESPIPDSGEIKAVFYEGLPYKGKKTKVFAWYGVPAEKSHKPFPAVVCAHGGGGTAMKEWVRVWNEHGYAAIAMDMEGYLPVDSGGKFEAKSGTQHQWHGPARSGIFGDIDKPVNEQWMYHAVADVILANSLIRSFPEVDSERIGLTGISWGGIVSSIVMGIDERFKFSIPVYGCGFLYESENQYQATYEKMKSENARKCRNLWDGSSYLANAKMPSLWINGTNDNHFYPTIFQKSYESTSGQVTICFKTDIKHGHGYGWQIGEIYAFADSIVKGGIKLPEIRIIKPGADSAIVSFKCNVPIKRAKLYYTLEKGQWVDRKWLSIDVSDKIQNEKIIIGVPNGATAYFLGFEDDRGLETTSKICFLSRYELTEEKGVTNYNISEFSATDATLNNITLRSNLRNCREIFEFDKKGTVAFLGGSITEMDGYRPKVCNVLQKIFPQTTFNFINAGIASTCSTTGAFRLSRDVLSKGKVDLLFVEFAVNDNQDAAHTPEECIKGIEGIVRRTLLENPFADIVLLYSANESYIESYQKSEIPLEISAHEQVAQIYKLCSVNFASDVAERIANGEFDWKKFGGVHPADFGNKIYAQSIVAMLKGCWTSPQATAAFAHEIPDVIDEYSYYNGFLVAPDRARTDAFWSFSIPEWSNISGSTRERFTNIDMLHSSEQGACLEMDFTGNAIGIFVVAGPDAGMIEYSIDNGETKTIDLYHYYSSRLHYPRTVMLEKKLKNRPHKLRLKISDKKNPKSTGTAVRVMNFTVNGE